MNADGKVHISVAPRTTIIYCPEKSTYPDNNAKTRFLLLQEKNEGSVSNPRKKIEVVILYKILENTKNQGSHSD